MNKKKLPFVIIRFGNYRSDEIFSHAIKPAVQNALGLSDDEAEQIRIDHSIEYGYQPGSAMPYIPEKILEQIRDCSFVICDITGHRPNCYFELGYALAYQKYVILVHDKNSEIEPYFDIRGFPYYEYQGIDDLRAKLEQRIKFVFGNISEGETHQVSDFFTRCKLPLVSLDGDKIYEYRLQEFGNSPIQIEKPDSKFKPPRQWIEIFNQNLEEQLKFARDNGNVIWNGDLVRLKDYHPTRNELNGDRFLRIETEYSDYYTFVSSNHSWRFLPDEVSSKLRKLEAENAINLRDSVLCNPLTVSLSLIIEHKGMQWVLIQERNTAKAFHAKQQFQCSAAGLVSVERDNTAHGIDIISTAKNELEEELGISVREDQIAFRGLIRETNCFEVGFVAEAVIRADPDEILKPSADSFEVKKVYACELVPEKYAEFIMNNGGLGNFVPLGVGAIVFSLMKRFPLERIENSMKSIHNQRKAT